MSTSGIRTSLLLKAGILIALVIGALGCETALKPDASAAAKESTGSGNTGLNASSKHGAANETYKDALDAHESENYERSVQLFTRVLSSNDRRLYASAYINRAQGFKKLERYEESLADHNAFLQIKRATKNLPVSKRFYLSRAEVLAELDRKAEARADIEHALSLVDEHENLFGTATSLMYAVLYQKLGDKSKAIAYADKAVDTLKNTGEPITKIFGFMGLLARSRIYVESRDYSPALQDIASAESFLAALFQSRVGKMPENASVNHVFELIVSLYKAWILDLDGQNQAAILSLQNVKNTASHLQRLSPEPEKVIEMIDLVDRAIAELNTLADDGDSQLMEDLVREYGKSFSPTIGFTEKVTLNE